MDMVENRKSIKILDKNSTYKETLASMDLSKEENELVSLNKY